MARVLLVEDEPWLAELYMRLLSRQYDVRWVRDGYDALQAIEASRPDVIVLDIMLPWANGVQLMHELVSYSDTATIPIVIFSAALAQGQTDEALWRAYGVVAVLDKTTTKPHQVLETVNGVLKAHVKAAE